VKVLILVLAVVSVLGSAVAPREILILSQSSPGSADSTGWTIETVDTTSGGSSGVDLKLDSTGTPRVAYNPPTEVMHAIREAGSWNTSYVASKYWGTAAGDTQCLAIDKKGVSHVFFDNAGLYHAVPAASGWSVEEVDKVTSPTTWVSCQASVDSHGRLHVAYATKLFVNRPGEIKYAMSNGTGWSIEKIDEGGLTAFWVSIVVDSQDNPHILYYADSYNEVRHAYRTEAGNWVTETVEYVGFIQYGGKHGALSIDSTDSLHAAYISSVKAEENRATLRYAVRDASGWAFETVAGSPGLKGLFTSLVVDADFRPHVSFIAVDIRNPVSDFDDDLVYAYRNDSGWSFETVIHGEPSIPRPWFSTIAADKCSYPHIATYLFGEKAVKYATKGNCTSNRPPTANAGGPYTGYEGSPLTLTTTATDPDNDPLTYRWDFDNDGTADTSWSSSPVVQRVWGDDCTCTVRVEVSDNKTTSNATATVTILNLPPRIDSIRIPAINATATLRIAGEKWHDVSVYLVDGGSETLVAKLIRQPGKPQESSFPVIIDPTSSRRLRIIYTPLDDKVNGQPNGATPAWLNLTFDSGPPMEVHHTFNIKHPDTWNWSVSLNQLLAGRSIDFAATATDPGSDDLTFTWEWGDGSPATATIYYNDGIGPDPYPSPGGTFPFTTTDSRKHVYSTAGKYDLKLTVRDDDGDLMELLVVTVIA